MSSDKLQFIDNTVSPPINREVSTDHPFPSTASFSGTVAGTVIDGGNVVEGVTTDAAVTTDVSGTISAKLRGLVKIFADVWDSVNHALGIKPGTTSLASATANATAPLAVQAMVSDGTNNQRLIAPISLADGVNGNNQIAAGLYVWNGASWDRLPGTTAGLKTAPIAGENHIGSVGGQIIVVGVELTRPADTTAYAALDAVSDSTSAPTLLTFANVVRVNQGSGYITKIRLLTDQVANVTAFDLHLYHTAPTPINDNAQQTVLYANKDKKIGLFSLPAMQTYGTGSTNAFAMDKDSRIPFTCDSASRTIYGMLSTPSIFTPASNQKFYVELTVDCN